MNPIRYIGQKAFSSQLEETGPSLSFQRLCTSRHVDDLQAIASGAIICIILAFLFLFAAVLVPSQMHKDPTHVQNPPVAASEPVAFFEKLKNDIVPFAGAIAVLSATLGWAYQAGSKRLGAVDLFASEIGAINRVCLVVDFARGSVRKAQQKLPANMTLSDINTPPKFTSEEHYTPVYDNNTSDLQSLDFDVVTEVTQFYTYRKTMVDFMRKIAETKDSESLTEARKHMIYMQYLMYESGRNALSKLIEFEPDRSSALVSAYCNELALFAYLKEEYTDLFISQRLEMRAKYYEKTLYKLAADIARKFKDAKDIGKEPNIWERANVAAPEMLKRYETMLAECNRIKKSNAVGTVLAAA